MIVSFYTPAYAEEAAGLVASLDRHGLAHEVVPRTSQGSWAQNAAMKPTFLRERLRYHSWVWWLDADARVVSDAPLLAGSVWRADMAAHWRDGHELLTGTLYFAVSPNTLALLDAWEAECRRRPGEWDQRCLQSVVHRGPLVMANLPASYCCVPDFMPGVQGVVVHEQASRRLRLADHRA